MKTTLYAIALMAALSVSSFAADWTGKLVDTACTEQKQKPDAASETKMSSCDATTATTSFAIDVAGRMYKLDANGNSKAATALRARADRSADPAKALSTPYNAKVTGTEKDGVITVDNIEVQ